MNFNHEWTQFGISSLIVRPAFPFTGRLNLFCALLRLGRCLCE